MATAQRDYYEVLGVARDADAKAIKDAFRNLALRYHPDRNKEPGAEERFKGIAEAYAVLSDPQKRKQYDTRGFAGVAGFSPEDLFGGIDFEEIFGRSGFGFDFGHESIFDRMFGRRRERRAKGPDAEVQLIVPLSRILHGGEEPVHFARRVTCASCKGSGAQAGTAPRTCDSCGGKGQQIETRKEQGVSIQRITTCEACGGRGTIIDKPCADCRGRGETEREETLVVKIPVGVEEGTALRIPGRGATCAIAGGAPGDLYVVVYSSRDEGFERQGVHLWRSETIEVTDAVLGADLEVPSLDGPVAVKVAPGTQPETVLRLRGKGLPELEGSRRGDLFVTLHVHLPEKLSPQQRDLYHRLRAAGEES
jgi:molecular chaperone DnaJ